MSAQMRETSVQPGWWKWSPGACHHSYALEREVSPSEGEPSQRRTAEQKAFFLLSSVPPPQEAWALVHTRVPVIL